MERYRTRWSGRRRLKTCGPRSRSQRISRAKSKLDASVGGDSASISFKLKEAGPDLANARLVVDREAEGTYLPIGRSQRYSVLVEKDGQSEPATDVHWPADFENDYVKWEAPVLTAKRENYTQFLRAEVGGRNVLWHTTTYRPGESAGERCRGREEARLGQNLPPARIAGGAIGAVPGGGDFTDFKVEVHYPDGYTRFVTKKAFLTTPEPPSGALVTADHGKLIGLRPGKTQVNAEFQGVVSKVPLDVEVLADVDIDSIAIEPGSPPLCGPASPTTCTPSATKNGQSVGDITGLGNLTWKSSQPEYGPHGRQFGHCLEPWRHADYRRAQGVDGQSRM